MKTIGKVALAAGMFALAPSAQAQVSGIGTANELLAIGNTKSLAAAGETIQRTFQSNATQLQQKEEQRQAALLKLDTNKDKKVDDKELAAAKKAKNAALAQLDKLEQEMLDLSRPATLANLYAIETLIQKLDAAETSAMTQRRVTILLRPDAFLAGADKVDLTPAITTELDRIIPTLPTQPPANWQPREETVNIARQLSQMSRYAAYLAAAQAQQQQQRQQGQAAPGTQPAARPVTTTPAPAQQQPATPQPSGR